MLMDKPISVGDLVVVVRPCKACGDTRWLGDTFRVSEFFTSREPSLCCGEESAGEVYACAEGEDEGMPLRELKRIPPLDELEGQRTEENLKEPA